MKSYGFTPRTAALAAKSPKGYRPTRVSKSHAARQQARAEIRRQLEE